MNNTRIAPVSAKLRRGSEHTLNGKSVYVFRDRMDGTVLITDDKNLSDSANYWNVNKCELKSAPKYGSTLSSKKKSLTPEEAQEQAELDAFYKALRPFIPLNCMNCRKPLYALTPNSMRSVCAHILAKTPHGGFPDVAKNTDNILYLGCYNKGSACDCHSVWDASVERRVKMPVYEIALKRFEILKAHLTEADIIRAEEYLGLRTKSLNLCKEIGGESEL